MDKWVLILANYVSGCIFKYHFMLQGDAGTYECHANNKWSIDMRSFRTDYTTDYD